jgi:NitT/TauT family transport system substrate-binding protein
MWTAGSRGLLRRAAALAVFVALALGVAACGESLREEQGGGSEAGQAENGARPIKIAGVFCVCFVGPYVAWKKGFFEKEGVPVDQYIATKGGSDTFTAVASGDVDFGLSGLDAIIRGREKGLKVRSLATVSPEFYAITVREDLAGEIRTPADLKGKKVAISKIGSASWAFLQFATRQAGLEEGDVEILQLGGIDTIVAGLKSGRVDAAVTWEPGTAQAEDMGIGAPIINALRPEDHQKLFGAPSSIAMTLAVRDDMVEKNPDTIKRAVRALDQAYAWIHAHSPEEVADAIEPLASGVDRKVLVAAVEDTLATMPKSTAISEEAFTKSATVLKEAGVIEEIPPLEEPFSCDFAECAK